MSQAESNRNDLVCWLYQTNRNPFVDHPEYVAAAFIPPLQITRTATNLLLHWSADYAPTLRPESTTNLSAIGIWTLLTNTPTLTSNTWTVPLGGASTAPLSGPCFYRLQLF